MDKRCNGSALSTVAPADNTTVGNYLNMTLSPGESDSVTDGNSLSLWVMITIFVIPGLTVSGMALPLLVADMKKKVNPVKQLLTLLCIADILGIITVTAHHVAVIYISTASYAVCAAIGFLSGFLSHVSAALATLMSVERCLAFTATFWYSANMRTWKVKCPVLLTLVCLVFINVLTLLGFGFVFEIEKPGKCSYFPSMPIPVSKIKVYSTVYAAVGFLFVAVDVICNIIVVRAVIKMTRLDIGSIQPKSKLAEYELTKMLFFLSLNFLICWTPLYVSLVLLNAGFYLPKWMSSLVHTLAGINFSSDPFIYIFCMKNYRRTIKDVVCRN